MTLTDAERAARYRERHKAGAVPVHYRRPADRRARPAQWQDAVQTLLGLLDQYQAWRDGLPPGLEDGRTAQRLDDLLALREHIEALEDVEFPAGFGRD
jgi:hypothetical protein